MTLSQLIEKLEGADEGSRELDVEVWAATEGAVLVDQSDNEVRAEWQDGDREGDWQTVGWIDPGRNSRNFTINHTLDECGQYTTSIDAALELLGNHLPGWSWHIDSPSLNAYGDTLPARAQLREVINGEFGKTWINRADGQSHSTYVAICIALLKALQAKEEQG